MAKPTTGLFNRTASKAESKAQQTNSVFRSIVKAEANARDANTARLRELRLAREAAAPPPPEPKKRAARAKPAAKA